MLDIVNHQRNVYQNHKEIPSHTCQNVGKEMATHSSVLAWRIPGTEEPGGLPPVGSHRVGHDRSNLAAAACQNDWFFFFFFLKTLKCWQDCGEIDTFCVLIHVKGINCINKTMQSWD